MTYEEFSAYVNNPEKLTDLVKKKGTYFENPVTTGKQLLIKDTSYNCFYSYELSNGELRGQKYDAVSPQLLITAKDTKCRKKP